MMKTIKIEEPLNTQIMKKNEVAGGINVKAKSKNGKIALKQNKIP